MIITLAECVSVNVSLVLRGRINQIETVHNFCLCESMLPFFIRFIFHCIYHYTHANTSTPTPPPSHSHAMREQHSEHIASINDKRDDGKMFWHSLFARFCCCCCCCCSPLSYLHSRWNTLNTLIYLSPPSSEIIGVTRTLAFVLSFILWKDRRYKFIYLFFVALRLASLCLAQNTYDDFESAPFTYNPFIHELWYEYP